jgi:hypothetical protein
MACFDPRKHEYKLTIALRLEANYLPNCPFPRYFSFLPKTRSIIKDVAITHRGFSKPDSTIEQLPHRRLRRLQLPSICGKIKSEHNFVFLKQRQRKKTQNIIGTIKRLNCTMRADVSQTGTRADGFTIASGFRQRD